MAAAPSAEAVILTASALEYQAVRMYLGDCEWIRHGTGTLFEVGTLEGTAWRVALAETGTGGRAAAVITEHAREQFGPEAVFFVGVAGAVRDVLTLGDVVVATLVHAYQGGEDSPEGFLARPESWQAPHTMLQTARHALRGSRWHALVRPPIPPGAAVPQVHFAPIAAGDVELNSSASPLRDQLHRHYNDAVAVEMESVGMAHAAHLGELRALTVRGISDLADGSLHADTSAEQRSRAAAHAAAATVAILRDLPRRAAPVDRADGAVPGPALPRVLAPDRASLQAYKFPPVARHDLLDAALRARDLQQEHGAGSRVALVLTGEGGIGKSVLLGQLLQRLERDSGAVVLVSCAQLSHDAVSDGPVGADRALGAGARPVDALGIIEILTRLRARHGHVTLLVDTLDLILDRRTVPGLSAVLTEALDIGDVVMTCRDHEYRTYLQQARQSAPRLAGRLVRFGVPVLLPEEIVGWARNYLRATNPEPTASDQAFIGVLEGKLARPGPLRQVCALPVRLAMACSVYAGEGHVPEELTATRLYDDYWHARVRTVGGMEDPTKERAALELARLLVTAGGTLTVRVPKGLLGTDLDHGIGLLVSEGVVRSLRDHWEFFHQSFGEYAHGRHLLGQGLDCAGITDLARALGAGYTNLWPLAKSLLSQVVDDDDYRELARSLPADSPDGAQAHVVAALGRQQDVFLGRVLDKVEQSCDLMQAVVPMLGEAPDRHLGTAQDALVRSLVAHPAELALPAVAALASLLPRVPAGDLPSRLRAALGASCEVRSHLDPHIWESLPARLLSGLSDTRLSDSALEGVRELYPRLGALARREAIRAHLRCGLPAPRMPDFARVILAVALPPSLGDEEAVELMRRLWDSPEVRDEHGWCSWREVLTARLPKAWDNAQVKFVARVAVDDVDTCREILEDILDGGAELTRHVNVLALLTEHHAELIARHVLDRPQPGRAGAGSVAYTM